MNIGEKIKQLRTHKNLTQPQLAEAIGIEQSYLSKLENGCMFLQCMCDGFDMQALS